MSLNNRPFIDGYALDGTPLPDGRWREIFNSDSAFYGGSNIGNGVLQAEPLPWMGLPWSAAITLPPLGAIMLEPEHG